MNNSILGNGYAKITVLDLETGKEIAVITNELVTTADQEIAVKLTPKC